MKELHAPIGSCLGMNFSTFARYWRHVLLALVFVGSLAVLLAHGPMTQEPGYHHFADRRTVCGIPNFLDVASNVPFLVLGAAGLWLCNRGRSQGVGVTWAVVFAGIALVGLGSAYYHCKPNNDTLVWDRLPMTIAFMGLFASIIGKTFDEWVGRALLVPALLLGCLSVAWWRWFDDLRLYVWVQYFPLLVIPLLMSFFERRYSHRWLLLLALGCYVLAKVTEVYDPEIFSLTGDAIGGHALKHVFAATGCWVILEMLRRRKRLAGEQRTVRVLPPRINGLSFGG